MMDEQLGRVIRVARESLGLTQKALALRAGVSTRLWAEVERGERPNVSFSSALRMLAEVGVSVRLTEPGGTITPLEDTRSLAVARAARAVVRRGTWTGRQSVLSEEGREESAAPKRGALGAVARVSEQAFALAPPPQQPARTSRARPSAARR